MIRDAAEPTTPSPELTAIPAGGAESASEKPDASGRFQSKERGKDETVGAERDRSPKRTRQP